MELPRWLSGKRICLPMQAPQEPWIWSVVWEDTLKEQMTTNSSILAWIIPWIEELGGLQSMGSQRVGHNWVVEHTCMQEGMLVKMNMTRISEPRSLIQESGRSDSYQVLWMECFCSPQIHVNPKPNGMVSRGRAFGRW